MLLCFLYEIYCEILVKCMTVGFVRLNVLRTMDRFSWSNGVLTHEEQLVCQQTGVRLYDGHDKARCCCCQCRRPGAGFTDDHKIILAQFCVLKLSHNIWLIHRTSYKRFYDDILLSPSSCLMTKL